MNEFMGDKEGKLMSHSYYNIWLHVVFSTKYRETLIDLELEKKLFPFINHQLQEMKCFLRVINGMPDHLHLLYAQNPTKTISETVKKIKGTSSHWINQEKLVPKTFAWQVGYAAFSVSKSNVGRVARYIKNQKHHHQQLTFEKEYELFNSSFK